jgi:hypothetical protein
MDFDRAQDKEIVDYVVNNFKRAKTAREPREALWLELYQLYNSYTAKEKPDGSNLFIPYVFSIIETVVPRIMAGLFSARPWLGILPLRSDMVRNAKALENLLDYQLTQKMGFFSVAASWIKETCIYGTGILKVGWEYKEEEVTVTKPLVEIFGIPLGSQPVKETKVTVDDPYVEHIDLWDFFVDPDAKDIDSAKYCIHRSYPTIEELEQKAEDGLYKNIDEVKKAIATSEEQRGRDERLSSIGMQSNPLRREDEIVLIEYWEDDRVIGVVNDSILVRNDENPFYHRKKPFLRLVDIFVPHEFYGKGEVEIARDMQYELNSLRNARMDNVNLLINRMWKVLRGADIDLKQLRSRAGGIIEVDDMNDIEELTFTDIASSSYMEDSRIREDMDRAVGVFDYTRGETTDRRETATTASILSQSADERFKLKVRLMEDTGLRRLGQLLVALNQQFLTSERAVRILGTEGMEFINVSPQDIIGQYDVMPLGTTIEPVVNKQARLDNLINMYNLMKDSPYIDHVQLLKRILEGADIKDVENIVIDSQEALMRKLMGGMTEQDILGAEGAVPADTVPVNTSGGVMMNERR